MHQLILGLLRSLTLFIRPDPDLVCGQCGEDLNDVDEDLYSEWEVVGTDQTLYYHNDEECDTAPKMSYYNKCNCCEVEFDISTLDFDVDENKNIYCSITCRKKHIACLANVEEPDIVY
jgi:hypothetical protein